MTAKAKTYLQLFASSFYISAVTFGSGYVIVSVIKKRFVDELKWVDEEEMLNLMALAQSSPGVITANTAMLVGYKVCGPIGAFLAVLGIALPPLFTISIISIFYSALRDNAVVSAVLKGMQAGASAVLVDVVFNMLTNAMKTKPVALRMAIMAAAFVATYIFEVNVFLIVLFCVALGVIWHVTHKEQEER